MPGGVSSSLRFLDPPRVFTRAKGARVWDADGREYVDFHAAFGPVILGHADDEVGERALQAISEVDIVGAGSVELELRLAEKIQQLVPSAEKVLFSNSGSEATYHAIRVSRAVTGRRYLVKFQGCYHGWHDYASANVISAPDRVGRIDPTSAGVLPQALDWLIVLPFNDVAALEETMAGSGADIAAVIVEPVIHTIGCVPPTAEFVAALRRTTTEQGSILIFDEVVTGFRHHLGGYQAIAGVRPDLTTFAKAIANGYPLAVLCGRADLMDRFNTRPEGDVLFGGTYNGNPLSAAAALATIERLEADGGAIHERMFRLGERLRAGLAAIVDRLGLEAHPQAFGSVFVCYFTARDVRSFDDALTSDARQYVEFHRQMTERGFLMLPLNLKRNHLMAAHTDADIDAALTAADEVLTSIASSRDRRVGSLVAASPNGDQGDRRGAASAQPGSGLRPTVVVLDPVTSADWSYEIERKALAARGVDLVIPSDAASADVAATTADIIVLSGIRRLEKPLIRQLTRCVGIVCHSAGTDQVDEAATRRAGIPVRNIPNYCTDEVSDHAIALMLSAQRRIPVLAAGTSGGSWPVEHSDVQSMRRLRGQTLGVIGAGRIGRAVAGKARAFGFRTIAFDPVLTTSGVDDLELQTFDTVLGTSDVIVLCAPLTPASTKMIDAEALRRVRPGLIIVNVARGGLIDEAALAEALRDGRVAAAALDVRDPEPPDPAADPLAGLPNVVVTPHVAAASIEARQDLHAMAAEQVLQLLEDGGRATWNGPPT